MPLFSKSLSSAAADQKTWRAECIILAVWVITNGMFLWERGVLTNGEADKYISQAHLFLQENHPGSANFWLYFLQIALLSFCLKMHLGFGFAVLIQLLVNLAATLYFFKTLSQLFDSHRVALISTLLLLLNFPYQEFNVFLQTESLFQSLTLLLTCYLFRIEKVSAAALSIIILSLFVIFITRPNGLLYLPATFVFLFLTAFKKLGLTAKTILLPGVSFCFLYLLNKAMGSGGELDFMLPFREEHVICGAPTLLSPKEIESAGNGNSLYDLLFYIIHNFRQFIRLAVLKSLAFWGMRRPYFSFFHNLFLSVFFYSICVLALGGITWWRRNFPLKLVYLCALILLTWLTVILTCDDWHNRFFLSISPYLIMVATPVLKKWTVSKNTRAIS
ncbi:MAG: hypothetical protein P4L51_18620 [Puia sp.]|nr:hypothetical protein [Puia sp.]